ncbi:MAG TPA: hypothetical protein VHV78_06125 [Gemmatimonadaceae bacterium]|nr:hypothetical protein [Gemmatimonadaceae bacterium]
MISRSWTTKPIVLTAGVCCLIAAACASSPVAETAGGDVAPAVPVNGRIVPSGTVIQTTLNDAIGAKRSHVTDQFSATVSEPVVGQNGVTVVPVGAVVYGHVTGLQSPIVAGEQAVIRLHFDDLMFMGRHYPFDADISNVSVKSEPTSGLTRRALVGAAAGSAVGAIVSDIELSTLIDGGQLGGVAGTVVSLGTGGGSGGVEGTIPTGSRMTLRATRDIELR